jgi:hypothetical protein
LSGRGKGRGCGKSEGRDRENFLHIGTPFSTPKRARSNECWSCWFQRGSRANPAKLGL